MKFRRKTIEALGLESLSYPLRWSPDDPDLAINVEDELWRASEDIIYFTVRRSVYEEVNAQ